MNSVDFLDAVRERHGLDSDNKLAAFLGINRGHISLYRTGRRKLSPADCYLVADALDEPREYVLAVVSAEKARRPIDAAMFRRLATLAKKAHAATLSLLAITVLSNAPDASASQVKGFGAAAALNDLYIIRIRGLLAALRARFWANAFAT